MNRIFDRKIILEDGTEFYGYGFGAKRDALVELVSVRSCSTPPWWAIRKSSRTLPTPRRPWS